MKNIHPFIFIQSFYHFFCLINILTIITRTLELDHEDASIKRRRHLFF